MLAHREGDHGIHHDAARAHALYQTSTMGALLDGIYDGSVTIAELLQHGDFGVGTFNHLDGEMVVNDGVCYHLSSNGEASVARLDELTPFAAVTSFAPDMTFEVDAPTTSGRAHLADRWTSLEREPVLCHPGDGRLQDRVNANSGAPGSPLPTTHQATDEQAVRTFTTTAGVLVGFRTPDYEQGISVAGYHLHFLNAEGTGGGHAFDFVLGRGTVEICTVSEMRLSLPTSGPFLGADLHTNRSRCGHPQERRLSSGRPTRDPAPPRASSLPCISGAARGCARAWRHLSARRDGGAGTRCTASLPGRDARYANIPWCGS